MTVSRVTCTLLAIVILCAQTACVRPPALNTVRIGYVPAAYYLPILVMKNRGLLQSAGLTPDYQEFKSNSDMINAFINGQLDVCAQSAFTMFPVEAQHPGIFKFVYGQFARSYHFVSAKDGPIKSLSDLKGKKLGIWRSPTADAYVKLILNQRMPEADRPTIQASDVPDLANALLNNNVDAIFGFDVQVAKLVTKGNFAIVEPDAVPRLFGDEGVFNGGGFIRSQLIAESPDIADKVRKALFAAIRLIADRPAEAREILSSEVKVEPEVAKASFLDDFAYPSQQLSDAARRTSEELVKAKLMSSPVDIRRLFWTGGN